MSAITNTITVEISLNNTSGQQQMDMLLKREGLTRDVLLDYACGIFDEDGALLACGGCAGNTLRCLAVSHEAQGLGLMDQIVTHLVQVNVTRGNTHLFVYTKPKNEHVFTAQGFHEILRTQKVLFMENRKNGFSEYLEHLTGETVHETGKRIGAIVMNANPFTLGHRHLMETAASECSEVHLFILTEENGLIPAAVRRRLVLEGICDMKNVTIHETGPYIISYSTFPSYFLYSEDEPAREQAELDMRLFGRIAKELEITIRYFGEEPCSPATAVYNSVMEQFLPEYGIECRIIPRYAVNGNIISAGAVRKAIHDGCIGAIKDMVPESTWRYFNSTEALPVIKAIQSMDDPE